MNLVGVSLFLSTMFFLLPFAYFLFLLGGKSLECCDETHEIHLG